VRSSPADTKVSEKGGGGGGPHAGAEIPLQHIMKTMAMQVVPLQSLEDHTGTDSYTAACGGPHAGAGGCAREGSCSPWRAHTGAGSWQELHPMVRSPCRSKFSSRNLDHWGTCAGAVAPEGVHPMKRTRAGAVLEELQPMERTNSGEVCEGLYPAGETPHWSRGTT